MKDNDIERKREVCEITEPSMELKNSFLDALEEYKSEGRAPDKGAVNPGSDFAKFIQSLKDESLGINMKEGRVPQTTYWITNKDGYAGEVSIRHELNKNLFTVGGHIGFEVRPSKRGKGYGNKALELILPKARALGLEKVLLTCDSNNTASKKIIENNGGVFENEVPGGGDGATKLRYWIDLSS